jgi:hypothetical protein
MHVGRFYEKPGMVRLPDIMHHMTALLGHEEILLQRRQGAVMFKLPSSIVILGGFRQHFHEHNRIEEGIDLGVFEDWLLAHDNHIGIGIESRATDLDAHSTGIHFARALLQLGSQFGANIQGNQVVAPTRPRHGKYFAVTILALVRRLTFQGKIFLSGQAGVGW